MKVEAGKLYRTRSGRKVRIYCVDGGGSFPVHGAILTPQDIWSTMNWTSLGEVFGGGKNESGAALVSEWEEPSFTRPPLNVWLIQREGVCNPILLLADNFDHAMKLINEDTANGIFSRVIFYSLDKFTHAK